MANRSRLISLFVRNIGCVGDTGLTVHLDNIVCLVGRNNAGKSTVLKAYELATGKISFVWGTDRCQWAPAEAPSEIILDVHIPEGTGNVDPKWKRSDQDLLIVRSRWQWSPPSFDKVRTTWDPAGGEWAAEGKAGGADPVFNARLPRALRIGSLEDASSSQETLLQLALSPFVAELKAEEAKPDSPITRTSADLVALVKGMTSGHDKRFNEIAEKVGQGFQGVFPRMGIRLDVNMVPPTFKLAELLTKGSGLRISDGKTETTLGQQGTGARRALFWSMVQVHNELSRVIERTDARRKELEKLEKTKDSELRKPRPNPEKIAELEAAIRTKSEGDASLLDDDDPAFPGYLLLVDEPENALHPLAARAAQRHLYKLAEDPDWQVMISTHSPYFINPLEDHTTIVRLERDSEDEKAPVTPRTFRTDTADFDGPTKKRLQAIQHMDTSLAEIFFGSYPIIVEGDTEHAAFVAAVLEADNSLAEQITVVRARGKAVIEPLIRIMKHFKLPFGVLHDADTPYRSDGSANGAWTENKKIREAVLSCRAAGVQARHRISIPDFERFLGDGELGKDKPVTAYEKISENDTLKSQVSHLLTALFDSGEMDPFPGAVQIDDFMKALLDTLNTWAAARGLLAQDIRFRGKGE
jgi:energy-coupling factor transporter ATP-binding protein EcfA2